MSESAQILKLADAVDDVRYDSVEETLHWVLAQFEAGGAYEEQGFHPTKCVVVMVDEHNRGYWTKTRPSAMKTSEELALLEVAKQTVLREMLGGE